MNERNYGIDGLRLLLMLMVVILHSLGHGGILGHMEAGSLRYAIAWLFEAGAYCAVNCFAMISGYVGVKSKYRIANILHLWVQVWFYAMLCAVAISLLFPGSVNSEQWMRSLFPLSGERYWFYTAYFGMSIFAPILNHALLSMRMKEARYCIAALVCVFSLYQTGISKEIFSTGSGYTVIWMMIMYVVGGYCRLYGTDEKWFAGMKKYGIGIYGIMVIVSWGYKLIAEALIRANRAQRVRPDIMISYISPTIVICAVALLAVFSAWEPSNKQRKIIAFLAPSAFSVYLLHDNQLVRWNIISNRFASYADMRAYLFPFVLVATVLLIFVCCIAIDLIKRRLFGKLRIKHLCNKVCAGLDDYFFG